MHCDTTQLCFLVCTQGEILSVYMSAGLLLIRTAWGGQACLSGQKQLCWLLWVGGEGQSTAPLMIGPSASHHALKPISMQACLQFTVGIAKAHGGIKTLQLQ